jgi:hypothetical protein
VGYDMYVVDEQGERVSDGPNHYWRRNISGGGRQARKFVELGLGSWADDDLFEAAEAQSWPPRPETVEYNEETDRWEGPGLAEWDAAVNDRLRDRRGSGPGIAVYKLCNSNDGWWVTKEECEEFLRLWEEAGRPAVDDFGDGPYEDTIPFIQAAAAHGGFRVY